jgi:precorrin-6B methylase 2
LVSIVNDSLRGAALLEQLRSIPFLDRDAWIDELLGFPAPPPDIDLPPGSVPYLPCGVEEIVAAVLEAPVEPDDTLVDLGSGLGRVVILASLISGARALGIEIQDHLVRSARARCAELALAGVSFVHADAAEAALDGSIFFLYAPCNGDMLTRLLGRLEEVARRRAIIICAVGVELHGMSWLRPRATSCASLTLYDAGV